MDRKIDNKHCMFYYSNLCHVCKKSGSLLRCSKCKLVAYCSKDHQKKDWRLHKPLCKVATCIPIFLGNKYEDFRTCQHLRLLLWQIDLRRDLNPLEYQLVMFPRVCAVCCNSVVMIDCKKCLNVSYCSKHHQIIHNEQHRKFCEELKLCMLTDIYFFNVEGNIPKMELNHFENNVLCFPKNLEEFMKLYAPFYANNYDNKMEYIYRSDMLVPVCNILHILENIKIITNRVCIKSILSIHIVGGNVTEETFQMDLLMELPFHWIKNLKTLTYHIIGPELYRNNHFKQKFCAQCEQRSCFALCLFHKRLYHQVIDFLDPPDLIIAFNNGLHEFHEKNDDTWKESIPSLFKNKNVPVVLTAYTRTEILEDISVIKKQCQVKEMMKPLPNPYSNLKPLRNNDFNEPIFYSNGYIAVLESV